MPNEDGGAAVSFRNDKDLYSAYQSGRAPAGVTAMRLFSAIHNKGSPGEALDFAFQADVLPLYLAIWEVSGLKLEFVSGNTVFVQSREGQTRFGPPEILRERVRLRMEALAQTPKEHGQLADAYVRTGLEQEAIPHYERAFRLQDCATLARRKGDLPLAAAYARDHAQNTRQEADYRWAGGLEEEAGNFDGAWGLYHMGMAPVDALRAKARALHASGRAEDAVSVYRDGLKAFVAVGMAEHDKQTRNVPCKLRSSVPGAEVLTFLLWLSGKEPEPKVERRTCPDLAEIVYRLIWGEAEVASKHSLPQVYEFLAVESQRYREAAKRTKRNPVEKILDWMRERLGLRHPPLYAVGR